LIETSFLEKLIIEPMRITNLKFEDISKIIQNVNRLFNKENLLLEFIIDEIDEEVYVIGDIHGNLDTLLNIIKIINVSKPKKVIFLGDIVDRGPKQLECLVIVLVLKLLYPDKYYLLRGNHETLEINQYYGFFQDFIKRFKDQLKFKEILSLYNVLPLCALINNNILCLHGGIPQDTEILKKLKGVKTKNLDTIFNSIGQSVFQIMWNDPKEDLQGFTESFRGPGIYFFGEGAFYTFMSLNDLKYLIRAHECFPEGYRWFFNKRLLSIFSSANYRGSYSPNPASYAIIRNNRIIPNLLKL